MSVSMFKTTLAVIPARIRAALDDVLDYVGPAEAEDYRVTPKALRKGHIHRTLESIRKWLLALPSEFDPTAVTAAIEARGYCVVVWCIDDVKQLRPDLTINQCRQVLNECSRQLDAEIGVNWHVIEDAAEELFPKGGAI